MTRPSADVLYSAKLVARRREVRHAKIVRVRRAAVAVLSLLTLAYGGWAIAHSRLFGLDGVEIRGAAHMTDAEILTAGGLRIGMNVLSIDPAVVERRIEGLALVEDARVERLYPSKLRIVISERRPAGVLLTPAGTWLFDPGTVVIAQASDALPAGVPVVRISVAPPIEPGRRLPAVGAGEALAVWRAVPALLRPRVEMIEVSSHGMIVVRLDGARVVIGEAVDLQSKFLALVQILERGGKRVVAVDLRAPARPAARYA